MEQRSLKKSLSGGLLGSGIFLLGLTMLAGVTFPVGASERIVCASTTSTQNSVFLKCCCLPLKQASGFEVAVVAVGTGQPWKWPAGDADVLLVHDPAAEKNFVEAGYGLNRRQVMYNDFIMVGPAADPAKISGSKDVVDAMKKLAASGFPFCLPGR